MPTIWTTERKTERKERKKFVQEMFREKGIQI